MQYTNATWVTHIGDTLCGTFTDHTACVLIQLVPVSAASDSRLGNAAVIGSFPRTPTCLANGAAVLITILVAAVKLIDKNLARATF